VSRTASIWETCKNEGGILMDIYKYEVKKIDGKLSDSSRIEKLEANLNRMGKRGYRLLKVVQECSEDSTESYILIFEADDQCEDSAIG